MADNIAVTAGSGTTVSTEEVTTLNGGAVSAQHTQRTIQAVRTSDGTAVDLGKAEDAASADGDVGIPALAVRKATPANTSGTDGDYETLQVSGGRLWASVVVDTALPAGTNAIGKLAANSGVDIGDVDVTSVSGNVTVVQGTASNLNCTEASAAAIKTAVELIDDTVKTDDAAFTPATDKVVMIGAQLDNTGTDSVDEGDAGALRMSANRNLYVAIRDNAGNERGLNIDASGNANITGTVTANAGTGNFNVIQSTASSLNAQVVGTVAHDSAVSGNPLLNGVEARDTLGTAVATGDVVRLAANRYGFQLVTVIPPSHASSNGTPITSTTTGVIAAPSAGNHLRIVRIHLSNGGATATWVSVRDGAAGTQHYRTYLPQNGVVSLNLNLSGPLDLTSATRLDIVLSAAGSVEYEIDYLTVAD